MSILISQENDKLSMRYPDHEMKIGDVIRFRISGIEEIQTAIVEQIKDEFNVVLRMLPKMPFKALDDTKAKNSSPKIPFWANDYRRRGRK